jgi:hypothetical protein
MCRSGPCLSLPPSHLCAPAHECDVASLAQHRRLAQRQRKLAHRHLLHRRAVAVEGMGRSAAVCERVHAHSAARLTATGAQRGTPHMLQPAASHTHRRVAHRP